MTNPDRSIILLLLVLLCVSLKEETNRWRQKVNKRKLMKSTSVDRRLNKQKQIDEHDGKVTDQTNVMGKHKQEKSCNMCDTRNVEFLENLNNSVWISCSPGSALEEKRLVLWKHFMTEGSRQTILFQDQRPGLFGMGSTVWIRR